MSEEEKKAIECIKQELIEPFYNFPNPTSIEFKDTKVELLERVINLVDKQQKEIERLDKKIEREEQYEDYYENLCKRQQEAIRKQQKEIEEKNRDIKKLNDLLMLSELDYISKDKIREKIKDYTEKSKYPLVNSQSRREYTFGLKALKELLEENDE